MTNLEADKVSASSPPGSTEGPALHGTALPPEPRFSPYEIVFVMTVAAIILGAIYLCYIWSWMWSPAIAVASTVIATQFSTTAMRNSLRNLAERQPSDSPKATDVSPDKKDAIYQAIKNRAEQLSHPIEYAVESYLSQVVANWAFVVLTFGNLIALHVRAYQQHSFSIFVACSIISVFMIFSLLAIGSTILFAKFPVEEYHDPRAGQRRPFWRAYIPPANKVTGFRMFFFVLYVLTSTLLAYPLNSRSELSYPPSEISGSKEASGTVHFPTQKEH